MLTLYRPLINLVRNEAACELFKAAKG